MSEAKYAMPWRRARTAAIARTFAIDTSCTLGLDRNSRLPQSPKAIFISSLERAPLLEAVLCIQLMVDFYAPSGRHRISFLKRINPESFVKRRN